MTVIRPVIGDFAADAFGGVTPCDQRARHELYLRGLLSDGKRKPVRPMGERLRVDHRQSQQFATTSTRNHAEVVAAVGGVTAGPRRSGRVRGGRHGVPRRPVFLAGGGADVPRGR
ncbi:transposase [Saccharothrix yanglingensis]|uniref:transposase n=1 Tax=Saccharothrix yanglingensis TaxID=659496 RepID=UPI003526CE8C